MNDMVFMGQGILSKDMIFLDNPVCLGSQSTVSLVSHFDAPVAQLDRAPDYGSGGWGFESSQAYYPISL